MSISYIIGWSVAFIFGIALGAHMQFDKIASALKHDREYRWLSRRIIHGKVQEKEFPYERESLT